MSDLMALQVEIEQEIAASSDSKRLSVPTDSGFAHGGTAHVMIKNQVDDVAKEIAVWFNEINAGRAGKSNAHGALISNQDPALIAFIAMKTIMGLMHRPSLTLTQASLAVARAIQLEVWLQDFRRHNKKLHEQLLLDLSKRKNRREIKNALIGWAATKDGFEPMIRWPRQPAFMIGSRLVDSMLRATGWLELQLQASAKKQTYFLRRTKAFTLFAEYWLQFTHAQPDYLPTVVPPRAWESWWGGGYYTDALPPLTLVKTQDVELLKKTAASPALLRSVNAMQDVGWRINRRVFEVFDEAVSHRLQVGGMPMLTEGVVYRKKGETETPEEASSRRLENIRKFEAVREAQAHWFLLAQIRRLASDYLGHTFWYPYTLDFRGRLYPVVAALNPQGTDAAKGLLEFSEGKKLNKAGWRWLKVHGANSWDNGLTKLSFSERVQFIDRNHERILQCAEAPLDETYWSAAENPWQFLAFCFEYASALRDPEHVCRLPIGMDGTCNGLQHFSAMLRDPIGGAATNLLPGDKPRDIYQMVADRVIERMKADNSPIGQCWIEFGVDRKATKRQVMTLPYGSTRFSCYRYTADWYRDAKSTRQSPFTEEGGNAAVRYLSAHIWEAIGDVVVAAREAMKWLQTCVNAMGARPITWTSPSGFTVSQKYVEMKERRIRTQVMGSLIRPRFIDHTDKVSLYEQRNGISPNFVHSCDAAHVVLTVNKLLDQGVNTFAFVHDNYLCLPTDAETMARTLRDSFVSMHETPALDVLAKQWRDQGYDIPDPPKCGSLDLSKVSGSEYFFA